MCLRPLSEVDHHVSLSLLRQACCRCTITRKSRWHMYIQIVANNRSNCLLLTSVCYAAVARTRTPGKQVDTRSIKWLTKQLNKAVNTLWWTNCARDGEIGSYHVDCCERADNNIQMDIEAHKETVTTVATTAFIDNETTHICTYIHIYIYTYNVCVCVDKRQAFYDSSDTER